MKPGRPMETKLSSIRFMTDAFIDSSLVNKFDGDIVVKDNFVIFTHKDVKYLIPLSNIKSAVVK